MIEKVTAYKSSDGKTFGSLEDVQQHELEELLIPQAHPKHGEGARVSEIQVEQVAKFLVDQKDKVLDILTTGPKSRPKARKANGATRKPRQTAAAQALALPSTK